MTRSEGKTLRALGVCVDCRKADAAPDRSRCWDCVAAFNAKTRAKRATARGKGKCVNCLRRKAAEGQLRCLRCLKKKARATKSRRDDWREQKLCTSCGGEIPHVRESYSTCGSCFCRGLEPEQAASSA